LAIIAGAAAATLAFRLLPPLSPAFRTRRLLALTLRDLRRLPAAAVLPARGQWESKVYLRLSVLPEQAEPLQRAQLLAAFAIGTEIIRLRRIASRIQLGAVLDAALETLAEGRSALAAEHFVQVYDTLATNSDTGIRTPIILRTQASVRAISEALVQHAAYFDAETSL
jgi:Fusaric acid resistance protein family